MPRPSLPRFALLLGAIALFMLFVLTTLWTVDLALSVIERLQRLPGWLSIGLGVAAAVVSALFGWMVWGILRIGRHRPTNRVAGKAPPPPPPTQEEIVEHIEQAATQGLEVAEAKAELEVLQTRKAAGEIHVALFGEISSGKSSLIRALLPGAEAEVGVAGGTTRSIHSYRWQSPAGDELIVSDMPGLSEVGRVLDGLARDEALRAHVVIYLCDGDLTRDQGLELATLAELRKPLILALNKIDRYSDKEMQAIRDRLRERGETFGAREVVAISTGGEQQVWRVMPDGNEELVVRQRPPRLDELRAALQRVIDADPEALEALRDSAVFILIKREIDEAQSRLRREQAKAIVEGYSKKAMAGAMAAISPGSDLLIQGYLGTRMVRELSDLYQVPVRKADTDLLLELVQKHAAKRAAIVLAIAGNALKAFPGTGTLAGGAMHAVAYGMLFRSLGAAVAASLEGRGELHPVQAAAQFSENLGGRLEEFSKGLLKYL